MKDFLKRLSSRKFLAALVTAAGLFSARQYEAAAGVVIAWVASEAHVDAKSATQVVRAVVDEVDARAPKGI